MSPIMINISKRSFSALFFFLGLSFFVQILYFYPLDQGQFWNLEQWSIVFNKLTVWNMACVFSYFLLSYQMAKGAQQSTPLLLAINFGLVAFNNIIVSIWGDNFHPVLPQLATFLYGAVLGFGVKNQIFNVSSKTEEEQVLHSSPRPLLPESPLPFSATNKRRHASTGLEQTQTKKKAA